MLKLVVCDIDNTLVVKHSPLSPLSKKMIQALQAEGVLFALASGRSVDQLHILEQQWGIECTLLIGLNGAEIYDGISKKKELLYTMKKEWIKEAIELMKPFECYPRLFLDDRAYARSNDETMRASKRYMKNHITLHFTDNDEDFYQCDAPKIGFSVKEEDMEAIEKAVKEANSSNFMGIKTEKVMYEFCPIQASKGNLLAHFCKEHDIDLKEVIAFGDMSNDISMLETAGIGVCMQNGSDDAKEVADYITEKGIDEDGWGHFVLKHLLHDSPYPIMKEE